jgi:hypothetical protein
MGHLGPERDPGHGSPRTQATSRGLRHLQSSITPTSRPRCASSLLWPETTWSTSSRNSGSSPVLTPWVKASDEVLELFTMVGRFDTANDVTLSELRRSGPMPTPNAALCARGQSDECADVRSSSDRSGFFYAQPPHSELPHRAWRCI